MTDAIVLDALDLVFTSGVRRPVHALRGVTLSVPKGAVVGLLGPNGAGKTTTISCMLGLLEPQSGTVRVLGREVTSARPPARGRLGVLLEDTRLPPFLAVQTALDLVARIRGVEDAAKEIDRVIERTGIGDLLERRVAVLSKGQARKVGLAAALVGDPELLVLDEPSAGLDAEARVEFDALVRSLKGDARTIVIASHLLGDVEATCSHIAMFVAGKVVVSGRADELLDKARAGHTSDVHVDATSVTKLDELGIGHGPSPYSGLVKLASDLPDEDLFVALAGARIVPRRVEPRVSVLSLYLDATKTSKPNVETQEKAS